MAMPIGEAAKRAAEMIREDPSRSNGLIAAEVGLERSYVRSIRRALGPAYDADERIGTWGRPWSRQGIRRGAAGEKRARRLDRLTDFA